MKFNIVFFILLCANNCVAATADTLDAIFFRLSKPFFINSNGFVNGFNSNKLFNILSVDTIGDNDNKAFIYFTGIKNTNFFITFLIPENSVSDGKVLSAGYDVYTSPNPQLYERNWMASNNKYFDSVATYRSFLMTISFSKYFLIYDFINKDFINEKHLYEDIEESDLKHLKEMVFKFIDKEGDCENCYYVISTFKYNHGYKQDYKIGVFKFNSQTNIRFKSLYPKNKSSVNEFIELTDNVVGKKILWKWQQ